MDKLAKQLIKLGQENPELRDDLRPILDAVQKQASKSVHITADKHWSGKGAMVKCITLVGYNPPLKALASQPSGVNLAKLLKTSFPTSKLELAGPDRVTCIDGEVGVERMFKVEVADVEKLLKVLRYGSTRHGLYWNDDLEI